ncbi:hypothetical protein KAJ61_05105 [Candidatus Parcubacteria bacterium]|nr:hypothetical protein [Candidatus Parcubacteria bacterium]
MKKIIIVVLFLFLLLTTTPGFAEFTGSIENDIFINTTNYNPVGGGSNDEIVRGLYAPSQSGTAIPVEPPRIFAPEKSKVWIQQRVYGYEELDHGTADEIAQTILDSGDTLQGKPTVQPLPYNQNDVIVLDKIPAPNIRSIYSNRIATKPEAFIDITIQRAVSHVKAVSNTSRVVILAELFIEGRSASRADALKLGSNLMDKISAYGLGIGTNYSTGVSRSFTGWVVIVIAYEDVPVIWDSAVNNNIRQKKSDANLGSVLFYQGQFLNNSDKIIAKNVQDIKRKWRKIQTGGVIDVVIIGSPYYEPDELENIGTKVIKKIGLGLKSELSKNGINLTSQELQNAFDYEIIKAKNQKNLDKLAKNGADGAILFEIK